VTVAFQAPSDGREFRLRHTGRNGHVVAAAWVSQEFPVRYPRRRPERLHLMLDSRGEERGLGGPNCMPLLLLVDLVVQPSGVAADPVALQTVVSELRIPRTGDQVLLIADPARPGGYLYAGDGVMP
jgi:hypothetical protein